MADVGIRITAKDDTGNAFGSVQGKLTGLKTEAAGIGETIGGLVGKFNALGIAIGGAMSVASIKGAIDTGDEFNKLAQKTGVAVESLRQLNYAASLSDVSTEALGTGLRKLSINMAAAAGGGKEQGAIFSALGLNVKDATGHLKGADTMLTEVAAKFANFKDGPEKAALAVQLFGKAGADMIPLLNAGATGLNDMAKEARDLGTVFSGDFAKNSEVFNDNLERLGVLSKSSASAIASELLPTLNMVAESFLSAQKSSAGFAGFVGGALRTTIESVVILFSDVSFVLKGIGREIGGLVAQFSAMGEAGGVFTKSGRAAWTAVGQAMREDAAAARAELDKFQYDLLNAGTLNSKAGGGRGTATDPRILGDTKTAAPIVGALSATTQTISEATKGLELYNSLMDQAAGFEKTWAADANKLRAALDGKKISQDQFNESVNALLAKQPLMVAAAKAEAEWQKEVLKADEDVAKARDDSLKSIQAELDKQLEQNAAIGLSVVALAELEAAKLTNLAVDKERLATEADLIDWSGALGQKYRDEATALRELASAKVSGAVKKESYDAAQDMLKEQKKAAEESGKYWEDAFMRAFESGKGFFQSLWDTIKNTMKSQVLKVTVQGVMGTLGIGAAGAAGASGSGVMGLANTGSTLQSLYSGVSNLVSVGSQVFGGTMSVANALGTVAANATGTGITGLLATNGAYGTAAAGTASSAMGGMTSALASIPGWGWAALGVLAVAGIASGRGETRSGAAYVEDASGKATKQQGPSGGEIAGDQARAMFDATKIKIQDTLKLVGSSATVSGFVAGLESSKDGHGFAYAGGLVNGVGFGDYKGRDGGQFGTASRTPEEAVRDYQNELKKATLEALQTAADIPAVISSQLKGVDINALDQAGLDNLTAAVGTIIDTVSAFTTLVATGGIAELRDLSFSAAAALIQFSGGLEALQTNLTAYYTNFYSAEEQRAQTIANINKVTAGSGFDAATASRDSFRALVESQDLTTTSGQATYAALISVAGAFAQLTPTLAAAAAAVDTALASLKNDAANLGVDLLTAQGDTAGAAAARRAIDTAGMSALAVAQYDANNATRALIASLENLKVSAAAALESTTNSANKAMAALQRAVAAQAKIYQVQVDAAQLAVSEIQGIFDTLESSITTLRGQVDSTQQAAQGRAFIDNALANAQTTGYLPDSKALSGAISAAMSDSTVYASQAESDFAKLSLAGSMSKLKDISSTQLSAAEQTLQYAQDQLTALDTILSNAQLQLDAANGIDVSVISVAAAVNNLSTAILTMEAERMKQGLPASLATTTAKYVADIGPNANVDPAAAVATTVFEQQISDLYTSTLGRAADTAGLAYWAGSGLSIATIAQEITKSAESSMRSVSVATQNEFMTMVNAAYGKTNSITAFAVGTNYVPRDMMANIHEGEAIVPKAYNPAAGGGQSDRLESLVEGLTKEVQRLQAIVNDGNAHARRTADTLDSVTEGGSNMRTVAT